MIFLVDQARSLHEVHAVLQERFLHQEVLDGFTLTAQDLVQKVVHHIVRWPLDAVIKFATSSQPNRERKEST